MLKKVFFFVFLFFFCLLPSKAHASEYFNRGYDISYTVSDSGSTHVRIDVSLTNKTSDYYASSDRIKLGFTDLSNIKAFDPDGPLEPQIETTDDGTAIELTFNKRVVGQGNTLAFTIQFDTADVAHKQGNIWEINIPGIANPEEFSAFNVKVQVPDSFGRPTYIKPKQQDDVLNFTKDELGSSGISIAYGDRQYYDVDLVYHLQNRNVFPIRTEIALPPSTSYQNIRIDSITPKPKNVVLDKDGNWLAEYNLLPSAKFDVRVKGKVQVFLSPQKKQSLSPEERALYTNKQQYWEVEEDTIHKKAQELQTPEKIYEYVVHTLTYDYDRVTGQAPRLGALKALANPTSAVCLEFTDLFIALVRAAGIPAREVNGFAYTQDQRERPLSFTQDILHSWPEYYDDQRKQWIMVDPTWGNTTGGIDYFTVFDFDHIVFVVKGVDSTYPVPAGGYKFSGDEEKKDVNVSFAAPFTLQKVPPTVAYQLPDQLQSGLPIKGTLHISNDGSTITEPSVITITSSSLTPHEQFIQIPILPPYASYEAPFGFDKTQFLTNTTHTFTMSGDNFHREGTIRVVPFTIAKNIMIGGIGFGIFTIVLFILARKSWRLRIFR